MSLLQPLWAQDRAKEEVCHSAGPAGRGRTNKLDLRRGAGEMKLAEVLIHLGPHLVGGQETWLGRKAEMEEAIREASQVRGQPEASGRAKPGRTTPAQPLPSPPRTWQQEAPGALGEHLL